MRKFAAIVALVVMFAAAAQAVPFTLYYQVSGTGPYTYQFTLVLDNNDNSWTSTSNQGWGWLIFGDQASAASPLTNWTLTSAVPAPWTGMSSSGGGHNGPTFSPVGNMYVPTTLNETRTWSGTSTADLAQGQMLWSTLSTQNGAVAANFTVATRVGAVLQVAATAGTAQNLAPTDVGTGNGISIGTFTLTNNSASQSCTLNSITITASGTGNDSNAFSQVALYNDTNGNGSFDAGGADVIYGTASTAYPSDNGALTFTASQTFSASQVRRYFVVVKLNGSTLAANGQTFNTQVTGLNVTSGSTSGLPSATMSGIVIVAPQLTVAATAGSPQNVYANATGTGGNGISMGTFTISNNANGSATLNSITLTASGSGNDSNAYSEVRLYEDTNISGSYDAGDTPYGAAATAFPSDNGTLTFTAGKSFASSATARFFVVAKLDGATPASPGHTFNVTVTSISVASPASSAGTPSTTMNGLVILAPSFTFTDNSSALSLSNSTAQRWPLPDTRSTRLSAASPFLPRPAARAHPRPR